MKKIKKVFENKMKMNKEEIQKFARSFEKLLDETRKLMKKETRQHDKSKVPKKIGPITKKEILIKEHEESERRGFLKAFIKFFRTRQENQYYFCKQ